MSTNDQIVKFIAELVTCGSNPNPEVIIDIFMNGYCYYFAVILYNRFSDIPDKEIMYEPVEGHFVIRIYSEYYDIRGNVTVLYGEKKLYHPDEWSKINSIVYGCILKEDYDICGSN